LHFGEIVAHHCVAVDITILCRILNNDVAMFVAKHTASAQVIVLGLSSEVIFISSFGRRTAE